MKEQFQSDTAEAVQASISMSLSNMNGIFALAAAMAGRGLLDKANVDMLHDYMLRPLTNDGGHAEMMALHTRRIDDLCATLAMAIEQLEGGSASDG
jgi:hypothetical protein